MNERIPDDKGLTTTDIAAASERAEAERRDEMQRPPLDWGRPGERPEERAAERPEDRPALLAPQDLEHLRERWTSIQTAFVDEPREAVQSADRLVAETVKRLAESFAGERTNLERQWDRGDQISTEDLRQALRRYRSFFDRLLSA